MKRKLKIRKIVDVDEQSASEEVVKRFNESFEELNSLVVDRSNEIEAIKLGLLSKHHIMLDGLHGTSKSRLAEAAFKKVDGAALFKKQFMKGTQSDEIFGPMISERYREEAVWEHNTEGMLPTAHFAYLDELFRASDMILPSMMGILNEREFINGGVVQNCPLITAIGTTNFVSEDKELDAFRDRFLITCKVLPLDSSASRLRMISGFLSRKSPPQSVISLEELIQLQNRVRAVKLSLEVMEVYEELVSKYRRAANNIYISDRRYCETLRLVQAFHVIQDSDDDFQMESLVSASYGLCRQNDSAETDAFTQVFSSVVGVRAQTQAELDNLKILEDTLSQIDIQAHQPSLKNPIKLYKKVKEVLETLIATPPDERPKTVKGQEVFDECVLRAESIVNFLGTKVGQII